MCSGLVGHPLTTQGAQYPLIQEDSKYTFNDIVIPNMTLSIIFPS